MMTNTFKKENAVIGVLLIIIIEGLITQNRLEIRAIISQILNLMVCFVWITDKNEALRNGLALSVYLVSFVKVLYLGYKGIKKAE